MPTQVSGLARLEPAHGAYFGVNLDWGNDSAAAVSRRPGRTPVAWVQFVAFPLDAGARANLDAFIDQVASAGGMALITGPGPGVIHSPGPNPRNAAFSTPRPPQPRRTPQAVHGPSTAHRSIWWPVRRYTTTCCGFRLTKADGRSNVPSPNSRPGRPAWRVASVAITSSRRPASGATMTMPASYERRRRRPQTEGKTWPAARVPASQPTARRTATPTATGDTTGNGNGNGTKKPTGYRQLAAGEQRTWSGLQVERRFTQPGVDPYDTVEWDTREAAITNEHGKVVFEQKDLEFPKSWSALATNVVASKYFRGPLGTPEREYSVKQMIGRVADTITQWGRKDALLRDRCGRRHLPRRADRHPAQAARRVQQPRLVQRRHRRAPAVLRLLHQLASKTPWSPSSGLAKTEGMLFKFGSGTGSNLSTIRTPRRSLEGRRRSVSGPVSFMKGFDAFAGVIKSGGKTRRAAKMVILNADHPDIETFIDCKLVEEKKAWALIDAGYDGNFNGGAAYESVFFQNSNNSVRVTDAFMDAVERDADWTTTR